MRCALVTGATGHLGRELCRQLADREIEVHGITRQPDAKAFNGNLQLHRIDGQTQTIVELARDIRPDTIFHLAAYVRRDHGSDDVARLVEANVLLGTQLLEAMRLSGADRIIVAGTYLQHADNDNYRALNLYAATKQAFEAILEFYADAFRIRSLRLTLGNIYSEHDPGSSLIVQIADAWQRNTALHLREPQLLIDPIHVEDAAAAFIHAADLMEQASLPTDRAVPRFSVTGGRDVSPAELIGLFEQLSDRRVSVTPGSPPTAPRRVPPWRGITLPGWTPRLTLRDGVARIIASRGNARTESINQDKSRTR